MSAHAIPAASHDNPGPQHADPHGPGPHGADTQAHRHVLNDLITMGADLARCLHGQAIAHAAQHAAAQPAQPGTNAQQITGTQPATDAPPAPPPDALIPLTLAFERIARGVRRGILLARSLARPVPPAPDPAHVLAQARAAARRQVIRAVEDTIQRTGSSTCDTQDSPDTLHAELRERLDGPDLDCDIGTRPAAEIIIEICRDLGIAALPGTHPWKRRTPDDIRQLCAEAAAPSGARQASTPQPDAGPQAPRPGVMQPAPGPQPDERAAILRAQPSPIHASHPGSDPPEDPAETIAMILRHPALAHDQWPSPPRA